MKKSIKAFEELDLWMDREFNSVPRVSEDYDLYEDLQGTFGDMEFTERKKNLLKYNSAISLYKMVYGEIRHWEVNCDSSEPGEKEDFKFVLHCYNKKDSCVDKDRNIPVRWASRFTAPNAKAFKPFGDFGDYKLGEFDSAEAIYEDQLRKLTEVREDHVDGSGTLLDEAVWVINERCEAMGRKKISLNNIERYLSCIIANGSKGIMGEIVTVELLKEKYEANGKYGVRRAPGSMESKGVDAQIFLKNDPEKVINVSIKCFKAFNKRDFDYFYNKQKKYAVDVFAGVKDLDNPELFTCSVNDI